MTLLLHTRSFSLLPKLSISTILFANSIFTYYSIEIGYLATKYGSSYYLRQWFRFFISSFSKFAAFINWIKFNIKFSQQKALDYLSLSFSFSNNENVTENTSWHNLPSHFYRVNFLSFFTFSTSFFAASYIDYNEGMGSKTFWNLSSSLEVDVFTFESFLFMR